MRAGSAWNAVSASISTNAANVWIRSFTVNSGLDASSGKCQGTAGKERLKKNEGVRDGPLPTFPQVLKILIKKGERGEIIFTLCGVLVGDGATAGIIFPFLAGSGIGRWLFYIFQDHPNSCGE